MPREAQVRRAALSGYRNKVVFVRSYCFSLFYGGLGPPLASQVPLIPVETITPPYYRSRMVRSMSRCASLLAWVSRLSNVFLPRQMASSSFIRPSFR